MKIAGGLVELPSVPHWPGQTPRPDDTVFAAVRLPETGGLSEDALAKHVGFSAGFEAFDNGYFWAAHEIWEPIWMMLPPASRGRHLLQGIIQLSNAALKRVMGRKGASDRILSIADTAVAEAFRATEEPVMGIDRAYIATLRRKAMAI